ncbi:hypothetical protein [Wolbachia endosymbiont of Mansonella perstans]|nr:hypothetical protein [Wolbachia endosymbiont of Mansonella perstans]
MIDSDILPAANTPVTIPIGSARGLIPAPAAIATKLQKHQGE